MEMSLPLPKPHQPYVHASALEAGHVQIAERLVLKDGSPTKAPIVPSLAFLLRHSETDKKLVFDLGIRKDWEAYPPAVVHIVKQVSNMDVPEDVVDSLRHGGLAPDQIDTVVLSHVHLDHVGDPSLFPISHFIVGAGAKELLSKGYDPDNAESTSGAHYAKDLLPEERTTYLASDAWEPIGPFPRALDFFGDGSVYLIDAAGHLQGHLNILARTSPDGAWLFLAGDSAHDVRLISGEREIAVSPGLMPGDGLICLHVDLECAKAHIERIRRVQELGRVQVLLAHDLVWYKKNRENGGFFSGKISPL